MKAVMFAAVGTVLVHAPVKRERSYGTAAGNERAPQVASSASPQLSND